LYLIKVYVTRELCQLEGSTPNSNERRCNRHKVLHSTGRQLNVLSVKSLEQAVFLLLFFLTDVRYVQNMDYFRSFLHGRVVGIRLLSKTNVSHKVYYPFFLNSMLIR